MPKQVLGRAALWAALAFSLHLVWEFAHVRLYEVWATETASTIVWDVLHCTIGDVLIALVVFLLTSAAFKDSNWPASRPVPGSLLFIFIALVYTALSEWHNVYVAKAWQYSPDMPLIAGIGLSPLLQWVFVPMAMICTYPVASRWISRTQR